MHSFNKISLDLPNIIKIMIIIFFLIACIVEPWVSDLIQTKGWSDNLNPDTRELLKNSEK